VHPAKIVIRDVQARAGDKVLPLLAEAQSEPGKPLHERANQKVVPVDVRRADGPLLDKLEISAWARPLRLQAAQEVIAQAEMRDTKKGRQRQEWLVIKRRTYKTSIGSQLLASSYGE